MDPVIRARWTAKLRSGEYTQGAGSLNYLADDGVRKHCCLGVLCEMAVEAGIVVSTDNDLHVRYTSVEHGLDTSTSSLPAAVQRWAGLNTDDPQLYSKDGLNLGTCSDLNDSEVPFDGIADLIDGKS